MHAGSRGLTAALLLLALAAPGAAFATPADGHLTVDPDPVPGDAPFTVRFQPADGVDVERGILHVCYSENGKATFCLLPREMRVVDGALIADADPIPPGQEFGVNLTVIRADGTRATFPAGVHETGREYVFYTTLGARAEGFAVGAPGVLAILAVAGAVGVTRSRR